MGNVRNFLVVLIFFSFMLVENSAAQDFKFKVLANKGSNSVSSGSDSKPLKNGMTLNSGQTIKVMDGSYVGLMHKSGRTKELKTAGEYNVDKLDQEIASNKSSVASKYADFVLSKMNQSDEDINRNHEKFMNATGAVKRGPNDPIKLYMPSSVDVFGNTAALTWTEVEDVQDATYKIKLYNMFDELIEEKETTDLNTMLDFSDEKYANERMVIVKVSLADDETVSSSKYAMKRLDPNTNQEVYSELQELEEVTAEKTAMNMLIMASFYEQHNLLVDALAYYQQAMELSPEVDIFRHAYEQFVVTNGLGTK